MTDKVTEYVNIIEYKKHLKRNGTIKIVQFLGQPGPFSGHEK